MKKLIFLTLFMVFTLLTFAGCSSNEESFAQKSYTPDEEHITEINIDVRDRQIEVALSTDNQIHINYFENSTEYYNISVSDGHVLTMTAASDKNWTDYIGGKSAADARKITLQLPGALLTSLKLSTTNGDILLPALTLNGTLDLTSNGGNIIFETLSVKDTIRLIAKNGDISGAIIGSYDNYAISCDIKKGESNLPSIKEDGTKTLAVSNNNGNIDIAFVGE